MVSQSEFGNLLDAVEKLSLEDQEALVEILRKRTIDRRRSEIAAEAREALREHESGLSRPTTVEDLMKEILP